MAYVCMHCGKEVKALEKNSTRCQYCGYRALEKKRSAIERKVSTD
jgi:DNA-directed RNA polymerase subunit RPC12/RpoP